MKIRFILRVGVPAMLIIASIGCAKESEKAAPASRGVTANYTQGDMGELGPDSEKWRRAPEAVVELLTQDLTDPKLTEQGLGEVSVKAWCDDDEIAFRIEWLDATDDSVSDGDRFPDAVAVQLPPSPGGEVPDPVMGQTGRPVLIHLWKASYQRRLEAGEWNLRQIHPNATVDHYPFEAAADAEKAELTRHYTVALAAGNPLAERRTSASDDLAAEGFGTLRFLQAQASDARGSWKNARWTVVIRRPLSHQGWPGPGLRAGDSTFAAFAVWDGDKDQAGSRKMRSAWVPLTLGAGA